MAQQLRPGVDWKGNLALSHTWLLKASADTPCLFATKSASLMQSL